MLHGSDYSVLLFGLHDRTGVSKCGLTWRTNSIWLTSANRVYVNGHAGSIAYLRELLGRIADHPINRISELVPWNISRPYVDPA